MFTYPESPASSEGSAEIGPPPYHHRSDRNICRKQDGLTTGSELLDAPLPGGLIVEGELFLVEHAPLSSSSAGTASHGEAEAMSRKIRAEIEAS
jgi:hypothetical protein